mmetsp:Transcript_26014/g.32445  ORF Transcript_26014/g.32445 Transcript_26014/m.32445 type:complete len:124 (-) Transcript_26014:248-619(-)|eukprot:CAMPEP_0170467664 /NCGR_PEP_ID=MMETSP0123-20130129/11167_1 /TAXON_ID=182087 /ORGANISM="Favella ehrenbergii, Strain Fehren 1" /LENGTH=123 /DNA_ID=CAMNT_0010734105 /DNA_START=18 /DNA_END=389 /DNA_ORIENTATION=-
MQKFGFASQGQMSATGANNTMAAQSSLKTKLGGLEEMIRQVNEEIQFSKREVQMLRQEKEQLENVLSHKSTEVRKNLQVEAERVDEELKRNLGSQKAENVKLQAQIGQLKAEKTQLQQNLIGL